MQSGLKASSPLRADLARSSYFALECFCEKPGWVRESNGSGLPRLGPLALPRSPESGVAVSTRAKFLSREKRKIWTINFLTVYILWCCSADAHPVLKNSRRNLALNSLHPTLYAFPAHNRLFFRARHFFHCYFHTHACPNFATALHSCSPFRVRRKIETRRLAQRRKNQRFTLSRRATTRGRHQGTKKSRHHDHRRLARRRSRQNCVGTRTS